MRALVVVMLGAALGCSDGSPNVGEECGVNRPVCDEELSCNSSVLGGYCTTACTTAGSNGGCPGGSICDNVASIGLTCLRICDDQSDCGRSNVTCRSVTDSDRMACKPN